MINSHKYPLLGLAAIALALCLCMARAPPSLSPSSVS